MTAPRNNKEHSTKISMKTMSILGKSGACFSPKQGMWGPTCYEQQTKLNKANQTKKKMQDAPSIAHNI